MRSRCTSRAGDVGTLQCWSLFIDAAVTAPLALDDACATPVNTVLAVPAPGVLANDLKPPPSSSMIAGLVTTPTHGLLTLNETGSFIYVPGCFGPDSFTYRAINTGGASNDATVSPTVGAPSTAQPPTGLYASSIVGNVVTL